MTTTAADDPGRRSPASSSGPGLAAILAIFVLTTLANAGIHDLWVPDELRCGQVAWEMNHPPERNPDVRNDPAVGQPAYYYYLVPHVNGLIYEEKPPLYPWAANLFALACGEDSVWSARLPPALSALLLALLLMRLGRRMFDAETGRWAGAILLATPFFAWHAITGIYELMFALFIVAGFAAMWRFADDGAHPWRHVLAAFFWLGLAVLTKGPLALVFGWLAVLAAVFWRNDTKGFLVTALGTWGLCIALQIAAKFLPPETLKTDLLWGPVAKGQAAWLFLAWRIASKAWASLLRDAFRKAIAEGAGAASGFLRACARFLADAWQGRVLEGLVSKKAAAGLVLALAVPAAWLVPAGILAARSGEDPQFAFRLGLGQALSRIGWMDLKTKSREESPRSKYSDAPHSEPAWHYATNLPVLGAPWSLAALAGLAALAVLVLASRLRKRDGRAVAPPFLLLPFAPRDALPDDEAMRRRNAAFLFVSALASVAFLSLFEGKRGLYMIPLFPLMSLLVAPSLADLRRRTSLGERVAALRWAAITGLAVCLLTAAAVAVVLVKPDLVLAGLAKSGRVPPPSFGSVFPVMLILPLAGALLSAAILAAVLHFRRLALVPAASIAVLSLMLLSGFHGILPIANQFKSPRSLLDEIRQQVPKGRKIDFCVYGMSQHSFSIYWGEPIPLIRKGRIEEVARLLAKPTPVFVLMEAADFEALRKRPDFTAASHFDRTFGGRKVMMLVSNQKTNAEPESPDRKKKKDAE